MPTPKRPLRDRFMEKIELASNGCWIWTGARHTFGYGLINDGGKMEGAHRLAWKFFRGPIPDGLWVLHTCPGGDNPSCCNPNHLRLGTALDNNRDIIVKGRRAKGDTRKRVPRGETHGRARLTAAQVVSIRERVAAGEQQTPIAAEMGVGLTTINAIVTRRNWRHV